MGHSGYSIRKMGGKHSKTSSKQGPRARLRYKIRHDETPKSERPRRYGAGNFTGDRWQVPQTQTGRGAVTTHSKKKRRA